MSKKRGSKKQVKNVIKKTCETKNRYVSEELAMKAVEPYGGSRKFKQYFCDCGYYHNASR